MARQNKASHVHQCEDSKKKMEPIERKGKKIDEGKKAGGVIMRTFWGFWHIHWPPYSRLSMQGWCMGWGPSGQYPLKVSKRKLENMVQDDVFFFLFLFCFVFCFYVFYVSELAFHVLQIEELLSWIYTKMASAVGAYHFTITKGSDPWSTASGYWTLEFV